MSRLIDADKLIEYIDAGKYRSPNELAFSENDVCQMIEQQPTAYDVDKVVEVLKNKQDHHKALAEYERQVGTIVEMKEHEYAIRVLSEAIGIVKRGGVI